MGRVAHYNSKREFFENEWFPQANAIGISWEEFWRMNPHIIKCMLKGYNEKRKEFDMMMWCMEQYVHDAVFVALDHRLTALFGKKAKSKTFDNPIFVQAIDDSMLTQEEIDEREMRKEILAMEQWIANDRRRGLPETKIR